MYSQIILLLFGLHTISAQLKNIPPPPAIPRLDVASLPSYLQKLLAHVNDVQSNLEEQRPQTISRAHTYGMSLRSGQGEVWNDITGNYTNDFASSEPASPSNNDHPRNGNNYHQTAKADEIAAPQTSSGKTDAIENYKDGSNGDQRLPSITPPQTLPLDKPKNEDQRGHSNPDKIIPSDITVQSQNIPLPTKLVDQKFKKTPSAKTYGMNLAGGHRHVWNNTGGSPLDVHDATPSESVNSESKDKHNPAAATNGNEFVSPATLQPIVYSTTPEATTEKPAIVNYKESNLPNYNQNLPTIITNNPATTVKSQNPVPAIVHTNKEDYEVVKEIKKASSPKTYGMNLSGGHGHVWNNIDESHFDINKATPSKSVQPELKDETTPAAVYGDKLALTTTGKPIVYSITPEGTSEKPTIVDKKHTMPSELVQPEVKDKTTPAAINDDTFRSTSSVKPVVYAITPETAAQKPAIFDNTDGTPFQSVQPELKDKTTPATDVDKFTLTTTVKAMYNTNPEAKSEEPAIVNYKESNHNQKNIPAATTIKPAIAVTSQNPVNTNTKDYEFQNDFKKYPSPKTYGMNLSGGHGHVWNNIDESHFDINKATPLKSVQPELKDKTTSAATNGDKFTWTTPVKPVVYTTPEATSENPVIVNNKDATPSESAQLESKDKATPAATSNHDLTSTTVVKPIVYTMSPEASSKKPPIINHKDNANNDNQNLPSATTTNPVTTVNTQNPVSPIAEDVKRASPRTYGMRLEGNHGYVWNDLIEPGMHYNLDEETNDSNNPTTANDENSSEVPVTKKPIENAQSNNNSYETINTEPPDTAESTEDPNTSNVSISTEKVNETTVSVTTERWTEPTSTEAFGKPSTKTPKVKNTNEANDTEKNTTPNKVKPESNEELKKYIERLVQEEVAKSLENAMKTDNINDKEIIQEDKKPLRENANNTLDNIPKNVTNFYGSLIGEGNVTNIFIFYPNDKNLESIVNDAKNIMKPQKNKSNETEANSNENKLTEAPSTLTTESSTTINTERPNTESTTTSDVTTSSEKDNDIISVNTENSIDSTTPETKTDSSTESYETIPKGFPNATTEANNKKDDETPELKEEIKKYIDKLVKDEVADQLDKERNNGIEKEKEPDVVPVTTEKSNNDSTDATSTESPTSEKNTEAPDSTNPTTSNEQDRETTSVTIEKSNNNTNDMITTEPSTTEEASTLSSEKTTTDTPNINSTTEVNTKNEDGTPSEPKMPDSVDDLKKYVEKLVKDEVAKLLNAEKNKGSENENEPDIIPVTTEKAKNDITDTTSTESPATEKNTEAPDSTNVTTISEQDGETTPVTTENTKNDTPDTTSTESPVSENNTGAPDSTNATSSQEDHASNPDPTENSNNDTNDTMSTESPTTEIASTQSSEKTTTENPNINSTTEANTKNEDGSPSEPKMPVSADELKKYVEKLVKDEVAKLLDAEKNNGSKKEDEPDAVPVTTEKSNNETTDTISTEFPATEKSTEASDSTNATTSSVQDDETTPVITEKTNNDTIDTTTTESPATEENIEAPDSTTTSSENSNDTTPMTTEKTNNDTSDMTTTESPATEENTEAPDSTTTSSENSNDTTPMTTEKTNNDTSDTMSTESPATEQNTEAPDSNNATESSEKDNDTTPVTTEGTTESTSEENKEQASTESSTSEPDKENDETTSSNMTPESKEEIKKYVEQLVKEEVAKLMAAGKNDASENEDAKPANATDEDAAPVES